MKGELDSDGKPYWWWTCVRFLLYAIHCLPKLWSRHWSAVGR